MMTTPELTPKLRSLMGLHPQFPGYLSMKDKKELGVNARHVPRHPTIVLARC